MSVICVGTFLLLLLSPEAEGEIGIDVRWEGEEKRGRAMPGTRGIRRTHVSLPQI